MTLRNLFANRSAREGIAIKARLLNYVWENRFYLGAVSLFWLLGIGLGIMAAAHRTEVENQEIIRYLASWQEARPHYSFWFWLEQLRDNLLLWGLIIFLGLSLVGCPLIALLLVGIGFLGGFNGAVLVSQFTWSSWSYFGLFYGPVNLLYAGAWLLGAAAALKWGFWLIRRLGQSSETPDWKSYLGFNGAAVILILGASLLQAYLLPFLLSLMLT